jgi:hypothetical protein
VIERSDGVERAVFHHYTAKHYRNLGYRVDLECRNGDSWQVVSRWQVRHPDSLNRAIQQACRYVSWLGQTSVT